MSFAVNSATRASYSGLSSFACSVDIEFWATAYALLSSKTRSIVLALVDLHLESNSDSM